MRELARLDPEVLGILRLSVFQLLFLERVPASAVVHDAVNLTRAAGKTSAAGFVNAVLRKVSRTRDRPGSSAGAFRRHSRHARGMARCAQPDGLAPAMAGRAMAGPDGPGGSRGVGGIQQRGARADDSREHAQDVARIARRAAARSGHRDRASQVRSGRTARAARQPAAFAAGEAGPVRGPGRSLAARGAHVRSATAVADPRRVRRPGRQDARARLRARARRPAGRGGPPLAAIEAPARIPGHRRRRSGEDRRARSLGRRPIQGRLRSRSRRCAVHRTGDAAARSRHPVAPHGTRCRRDGGGPGANAASCGESGRPRAAGWSTPRVPASRRRTRSVFEAWLSGESSFRPAGPESLRDDGVPPGLLDPQGHLQTRPDLHGLEGFFAAAADRTRAR